MKYYYIINRIKKFKSNSSVIINNNMEKADLKDPFNGGPKATLAGLAYFLTLAPMITIVPTIFAFMIEYSTDYNGNFNPDNVEILRVKWILDLRVVAGGFILASI